MKHLILRLLCIDNPEHWKQKYKTIYEVCVKEMRARRSAEKQALQERTKRIEAERQASILARDIARISKELKKTQARLALRVTQFQDAAHEGRRAGKTHTNKSPKK